MIRKSLFGFSALFFLVVATSRSDTVNEMLSDCRPWVTAEQTSDSVAIPPGQGAQRRWGAFGVIQSGTMLVNQDNSRAWRACVRDLHKVKMWRDGAVVTMLKLKSALAQD